MVGFRGSLAKGVKGEHKLGPDGNPLPFDPTDFDVDAFIVSDELASKFSPVVWWRSGKKFEEIKEMQIAIKKLLKKALPGFRKGEEFVFRIYTKEEFLKKFSKDELKLINTK